jgi:hypothetical protein
MAIVSVAVGMLLVLSALPVRASMASEASTTWEEDGDTIVHGVYVGNVGGASGPEIVTVGQAVSGQVTRGQVRVYEHNGSALTLKATTLWVYNASTPYTVFLAVHAADLNGNASAEIVAVGYVGDGTDSEPLVTLWWYSGSSLVFLGGLARAVQGTFRGVHAANISGDSDPEVIVAGDLYNATAHQGDLMYFAWDGSSFTSGSETTWVGGDDVIAYSVHAKDIDGDRTVEMVTAGYWRDTTSDPKKGDVRVWYYSGSSIQPEASRQDYLTTGYDTVFYGVYNANVDLDLSEEIVVCGTGRYVAGGSNEDRGVLWLYEKSGSNLNVDASTQWDGGDETACRSISVANLDGDNYLEMSAGGWALVSRTYNGHIETLEWRDTGGSVSQEDRTQWYTTSHTRVRSVFDANADSDGTIEVVSGGQANDGANERGELKVWHL